MKKSSKIMSLVLAGAMVLSMSACGSGKSAETSAADTTAAETTTAESGAETSAEETKAESQAKAPAEGAVYKIGILQLTQHPALDAANDGKDLILAIATPAAQAMAGAVTDTPVLITAVTDPAESGLVDTNEVPGGNVTGTSDLTPVAEQIDLLQKVLPDAKKIGILYCSAESNSEIQAQMAREAIAAAGMESQDFTVSSSNEIQTVVQSMVGKVDAVYAPTDNTIAAGMTTVAMVANDNNLPVICGESGMVNSGGLATYGIDYFQLGYMTGQQAVKILTEGASPADMPIEYLKAENCELTVNEETAQTLGIDVSVLK